MFYRQYKLYSNILLVVDVLAGVFGLFVSYYLRYHLVRFVPLEISRFFNPELLLFRHYLFYFLLCTPLWVVLLILTQRYPQIVRLPLKRQTFRAIQFVVTVGFLMGFMTYSFKLEISRPIFFVSLFLTTAILIAGRIVLHWVLRSRNINEHNQIKILIVGTDECARRIGQMVESYQVWGYRVVGYLSTKEDQQSVPELNILGSLSDLPVLLQDRVVADEIIFAGSQRSYVETFEEMVRLCQEVGIRTRVAADYLPTATSRVSLEFLEDLPLITFSTVPDYSSAIIAKRISDFVIAVTLLLLFSPAMLIIAILVKFTSQGSVFYEQVRCGRYGRKFKLIKFRTMVDGAEDRLWEIKHLNEMNGPVFKMRNDPRVTQLGWFLRKFSIDELPQFWNVIKGEMSIVGPRAPLVEEVQCYATKQRRRLSVKPGITCLWQISGRSDIDFNKWMEMDLQYIDRWSFWLDVQIMLKTIPAVFTGRGAR